MNTQYVIREGISGFRRAKLSAAGSILTIMTALLLLGLFYVVTIHTTAAINQVRSRIEMEVFLKELTSQDRIRELQARIEKLPGIARVEFVSKEEAAKIFKEEFGEDVTSVLDYNPLPSSFKLFLTEQYRVSDSIATLRSQIKTMPGVDDVVYRKDLLEFIEKKTGTLNNLGLALGVFISISAIFFVSNTIRLTIAAKRKAIQTMKLVGATWWFVRGPFLVEGVLQGVLGGLLAAGILYYTISFATGLLSAELASLLNVDPLFYLLVVSAGIILGFFGSAISVKRHIGRNVGA